MHCRLYLRKTSIGDDHRHITFTQPKLKSLKLIKYFK